MINLPNRLTLLRLAMVPAFMAFMVFDHLWTRVASLVIFIVASLTDLYDGKIARETKTVTVIGIFLDPLVDKMLICAALVGFVGMEEVGVPSWMVVFIISREFLITGLRSLAAKRGIVMAAEQAGKFKTTSQITAIITILVLLCVNATFSSYPMLFLRSPSWFQNSFLWMIQHLPYWMVFWVTVLTVVSGYLYIQKYRDLISRELHTVSSN